MSRRTNSRLLDRALCFGSMSVGKVLGLSAAVLAMCVVGCGGNVEEVKGSIGGADAGHTGTGGDATTSSSGGNGGGAETGNGQGGSSTTGGQSGGSTTAGGHDGGGSGSRDAGPRDSGAAPSGSTFVGTYVNCASGVTVAQDVSGFESWTYLRVSQSGNTVTASFVDEDASAWSVRFAATTETSAALEPGQTLSGPYIYTDCVFGLGDIGQEPATVALTHGELTYEHSTLFLSMTGTASTTDAGMCDTANIPATVWFACQVGDGGTPPPRQVDDAAAPMPPPLFPVGPYSCSSILDQTCRTDGGSDNSVGGSSPPFADAGVLTLAQSGAVVTADYSGDSWLSGSLRFAVATSTAATAGPGQTLATPCQVPFSLSGPPPPPGPEPLSVEAASLTMDGTTLFLSFAGTMTGSSTCAGAEAAGSLVCSKQ